MSKLIGHTENMLKTAPGPTGYAPEDFRLLCAWCREEMRPNQNSPGCGEPVPESHGICIPCAVKLGMPLERLLQRQVA